MSKINYKDAGVDIDAGNSFVEEIKPMVKSTFNANVLGGIGSFSGAFKLPSGFKNPALLAATDGVGTKLRLAIDVKKYDTIGIDLVAMCVNDLICNFAKPLFFLDYYATEKLEISVAKSVLKGISEGCKMADCSLIGGETAEMPSMYKKGDFDLAGFSVGMAEIDEIDRTKYVQENDLILALPSSGFHSNGYSLLRKLFFEELKFDFDKKIEGQKLIDLLLAPTRIYVKDFLKLKPYINALANITGGGLLENVIRAIPDGLGAVIHKDKIQIPKIYDYIIPHLEEKELFKTLNTGVGMAIIANEKNAKSILEQSDAYIIGEIKKDKIKINII